MKFSIIRFDCKFYDYELNKKPLFIELTSIV